MEGRLGAVNSVLFFFLVLDLSIVVTKLTLGHGKISAEWTSLMMGSSVCSFGWR